jgi:hypothetical protein
VRGKGWLDVVVTMAIVTTVTMVIVTTVTMAAAMVTTGHGGGNVGGGCGGNGQGGREREEVRAPSSRRQDVQKNIGNPYIHTSKPSYPTGSYKLTHIQTQLNLTNPTLFSLSLSSVVESALGS